MQHEQWRSCYQGYYEVSNQGRVRRAVGGGCSYVGRVLRIVPNQRGYLRVHLRAKALGLDRMVCVHTLVAAAFIGPCPIGYEVDHADMNKANCCVGNLEYVTKRENNRRRVASGRVRWARGERHGMSKLTVVKVRTIRRWAAKGVSQPTIARRFSVSQSMVSHIVLRKHWTHV
jgi:hypothetical protein